MEECKFCCPPSTLVLFQHGHVSSSSFSFSSKEHITFFTWAAKLNRAPFDLPEAAAYHSYRQKSHWLTMHHYVCMSEMRACHIVAYKENCFFNVRRHTTRLLCYSVQGDIEVTSLLCCVYINACVQIWHSLLQASACMCLRIHMA